MKPVNPPELRVIGRADIIDLPELGITDVAAKVDTGAFGCALHCHHIQVVQHQGKEMLHFQVLDPSHPEFNADHHYAAEFRLKAVRNSSGEVEERYAIRTTIRIFGKLYRTEFSLANRMAMKYPVLIGRKFVKRKFLVDVRLKNLSHKEKARITANDDI
jgi:hypothetical protein